jgi:hypothetical protein
MILIDAPTEDAVRFALLRCWCRQLRHRPGLAPEARDLAGRLASVLDRAADERRTGPSHGLDAEVSRLLGRLAVHRQLPPLP